MSQTALKGNTVHTYGHLPTVGHSAPNFTAVNTDLEEKHLRDFEGKKVVLNIFPSIDTGVCAASVRKFNEKANEMDNTTVLCISNDLPFALKRFCAAEGLEQVIPLSAFRSDFGHLYGVTLIDSPMKGLLARAVLVLNEQGKVIYNELVPEITTEPNYDSALQSLK